MNIRSHFTASATPGEASAAPPLVAAQVAAERLAMLHGATLLPVSIGLLFCLLPFAFLWGKAPTAPLVAWLAARTLCTVLRCADSLAFRRQPPTGTAATAARERRYLALLTLDGLSWGALALLPHHGAAPGFDASLMATLVGVCAIALLTLSTSVRAYALFVAACLGPLLLHLLSRESAAADFGIPGLSIFLLLSLMESRRIEARSLELLRLRFEFAHLAEARSEALLQAQRLAEDKRQMVATLSHEIRTPLNGMLGMAQLLARSELNPQQTSQLVLMQRSGRHLLGLVNDMLDLARIESGKLQTEQQPLVLREVIDEVCQLLGGQAAEKGLSFERQLSTRLPNCVLGDAARIKQVLHNLVGNAIKFTDAGSVRVDIDCDDTSLRFSIHDTGEGIDPAELERLFVPFEQAGGQRLRRREGTGLGLAISRELARAMGGTLDCRSTPGQGSSFIFTLPWLPCAHAEGEAIEQLSTLPVLQGRVLLVEDCPVNTLVATTMLERCGLQTELAEDGEQALLRLQTEAFDLVLMDCQLPGIDGFETTRRWRATEAQLGRSPLPIVALTANAGSGDRQRCLDSGMDDYLSKPIEIDALVGLLHRHLPQAALAG